MHIFQPVLLGRGLVMILVLKNIKNSIKGYRSIYIILIISQIISVLMAFFAYGVYGNFQMEKITFNFSTHVISATTNDNVYAHEIREVMNEFLEQSEDGLDYINMWGEYGDYSIVANNDYEDGEFILKNALPDYEMYDGRFPTDIEINEAQKIVYTVNVGKTGEYIEIEGEKYLISGVLHTDTEYRAVYISIEAFPDNVPIEYVNLVFEKLPTVKDYNCFGTALTNALGDRITIQEMDIKDEEYIIAMDSMITISVIIGIVAALDTALLYGYLMNKRRRQMMIMGITGAKRIHRIFINEAEIVLITLATTGIGVLLFSNIFEKFVNRIYKNSAEIFHAGSYAIIALIYVASVVIVTLIVSIIDSKKGFLQIRRGENG